MPRNEKCMYACIFQIPHFNFFFFLFFDFHGGIYIHRFFLTLLHHFRTCSYDFSHLFPSLFIQVLFFFRSMFIHSMNFHSPIIYFYHNSVSTEPFLQNLLKYSYTEVSGAKFDRKSRSIYSSEQNLNQKNKATTHLFMVAYSKLH